VIVIASMIAARKIPASAAAKSAARQKRSLNNNFNGKGVQISAHLLIYSGIETGEKIDIFIGKDIHKRQG